MRRPGKRAVLAAAVGITLVITGCGKSDSAGHHPGKLSPSEKIDNLCFELASQLKAAYFQAAEGLGPYADDRSPQQNLAHGEKHTLEQASLKSAPVMLSIAREVGEVAVPSYAHESVAALERQLHSGAAGYRSFAKQVHRQPARSNELAHDASAFRAPARPAFLACRATTLVLERGHSNADDLDGMRVA